MKDGSTGVIEAMMKVEKERIREKRGVFASLLCFKCLPSSAPQWPTPSSHTPSCFPGTAVRPDCLLGC